DKCRAALRTADLDFSLAFRDTDLLPAARTLIDMIYLSLLPQPLLAAEEIAYLIHPCKKRFILGISFGHIPREHPEIAVDDHHPSEQIEEHPCETACQQRRQKYGDQSCHEKNFGKCICAIPSLHETY